MNVILYYTVSAWSEVQIDVYHDTPENNRNIKERFINMILAHSPGTPYHEAIEFADRGSWDSDAGWAIYIEHTELREEVKL